MELRALGALGLSLGQARVAGRPKDLAAAALGLAAVAIYVVTLPSLWRSGRELLRDGDERSRRDFQGTQEQAALMTVLAGPSDFVLTDHPLAAFEARRPVPPWLVDTSGTRVDAGALSSETVIAEAERFRPVAIVTLRRRLFNEFRGWLSGRLMLATVRLIGRPCGEPVAFVRNGEIIVVTHLFLRQTLTAEAAHRLGCKLIALGGEFGDDPFEPDPAPVPRRPLPVPSVN